MTLRAKIFAAAAILGLTCGAAEAAVHSASADPAIVKPIDALVSAMNRGDDRAIAALLAPDAVIQDEVAPYRWLGPNAEAKWAHDDGALIRKRGVTHSHSVAWSPTFLHHTASHAYVAVPLLYTYTLHGHRQRETGLWTIVLAKTGPDWLITLLGFAKIGDTSDATWDGE